MATYGNQNYTNFGAVNLKGSTNVRLQAGAAAGTIRVDLSEGIDRAWTFPNKSGTFPISGTFLVQIPAITTGAGFTRTAVSVTGIRTEDALVITQMGDPLLQAGAVQHPAILLAAKAGNGSVTLTFANPGATATAYQEIVCAYTAVR